MRVRPVEAADVDAIVELGARMHREGAYAFLPFDREKFRRFVTAFVGPSEQRCWLVADQGGTLVGMLGGYLSDYFFCDELVARDIVVFVDRAHRGGWAAARLIRGFRAWAAARGAREFGLATSSGINADRTGRFYERLGLTRVGGVYKQRLR